VKNFWRKLKLPILALAPMAGVTDSAFRQICREQGADVVYTEMVSADGLFYDSKKTLELLKFSKEEKPVVIQLFGKNPDTFTKAAQIAQKVGFDGIDINFGCPAKKVVAHGGGVTLMRDLENCHRIIEAVVAGTSLPISVKIRAGIDKVTAIDFVSKVKGLPISALMIHGRCFQNPFTGPIDFEMISKVKNEFKGIVIGNGGINTPEDAKEMVGNTGVDGLGLARGIRGKPWLFGQIKDYLKTGEYHKPSIKDIKKVILRHGKLAFKAKDEYGIIELRKHLLWYTHGWPDVKEMRKSLVTVENLKDIKTILAQ